jgi:acetyltransferase-like isoleucine patch superfamily enzyme
MTIVFLRFKGCTVADSAWIHPTAVFDLNGGTISVGARSHVDIGVVIRVMGGHVNIGADCSINAYSFLSGAGGIDIADHVMMGSHVSIYASNHVFADTSIPMNQQGLRRQGVVIERDVWVGTAVRILDGVRVSTGSILAAGAVVVGPTTPFSINGGVPARTIGSRKTGEAGLA